MNTRVLISLAHLADKVEFPCQDRQGSEYILPDARINDLEILSRGGNSIEKWRTPKVTPKELTLFETECGEIQV